jgi:hypothetical protein
MPKAAIERGFALRIVELEALANTLQVLCMPNRTGSALPGKSAGAGKL